MFAVIENCFFARVMKSVSMMLTMRPGSMQVMNPHDHLQDTRYPYGMGIYEWQIK